MCGPVGFVTYKLDTNEAGNIQKIDSRQNKKLICMLLCYYIEISRKIEI